MTVKTKDRFCNQCMSYRELEADHEDWETFEDDDWICPYCLAAEQA